MSSLFHTFFGPLDKSACVYFFILTFFFFIVLAITLLSELIFIVKNYKSLNMKMFTSGILILFNIFLAYFVNRLFYTMCIKSLM
jgi:hypothetical protein